MEAYPFNAAQRHYLENPMTRYEENPTSFPAQATSSSYFVPAGQYDLPAWATTGRFGFARPEQTYTAPYNTATELFPGVSGTADSTLDQMQRVQTLDTWYTEETISLIQENPRTPLMPALTRDSALDSQHYEFMDSFWQVQNHNRSMYEKGKGKSTQAPADTIDYDGDENVCALCITEYLQGERVLRLTCRHMFHIECWNNMVHANESQTNATGRGRDVCCPNCRGGGRVVARFRYIAAPISRTERTQEVNLQSSGSEGSFHSVASVVLPWNPGPGTQPHGYFHATTELPEGQQSIIVDIGAWTNLSGKKKARAMAQLAADAGHIPRQWKMNTPLTIAGVGNGTQECKWEIKIPICVKDPATGTESIHHFETPTVEGPGEDLPALLGLCSISAKGGVIETESGKQMLTFPGPGGYKIEWSPGTEHFPLTAAPSGHLVIPLSDFKSVPPAVGGIKKEGIAFHARAEDPHSWLGRDRKPPYVKMTEWSTNYAMGASSSSNESSATSGPAPQHAEETPPHPS
jgi:hypothetical protein